MASLQQQWERPLFPRHGDLLLPFQTRLAACRSGRTGRAGQKGTTIALFTKNETGRMRRVIKEVGVKNLEIMGPPQPQAVMEASAKQVLRRLDNIDPNLQVGAPSLLLCTV